MPSERVQRKIDALLDEAEEALTRHDWDTARARAQTALALDHDNEDAKHYVDAAEFGLASTSGSGAKNGAPLKPDGAVGSVPSRPTGKPAQLQPESFASGRYAVKKFLGEGGKKKVYLAHDTTLDRDVAFALIKSESLDEAARRRILREAQAMGRLGDHPNIVPIHDLGTEGSQPFMVLPVMTGGDVESLMEKSAAASPPGLPLDRALQIAKDVCEGLTFAHSKGIVHRDLKPGNVWLTERGVARIGDFGLAVATDRSRLTREGMMVGTVAYMPPEQAMGGEITPRADLYSLGAMLYEMVTGRPPFLGDDDVAIIGQHINTPPVAPTWHRPDCPKPLDALIMRLLAKDSKQRPDSAGDVLRALEAVDLRTVSASPAAAGEGEGSQQGRSLDSISSGVFVGRQKEMDQLRAALEETLSGHGRMITLVGEPGIGKTRTAQELATYAGLRRGQVLWGRCYEGGGAPPYWPWVQAIRSYIRDRNPEDLRREMGSTASVIAEVVADVKERLPGLQPPPQLESPESARFRLFDSIAAFLKSASKSQPIVLVLDDLHWSDKPSLLLLEFIARELANSRLLVVGTYRDVEVNRRHPLSQTIGELTKERLFDRVLLRGVQKHDVERFIEVAAGVKPPPGLVEAVHTQTEGNPLFVTEVVRWLVQEGALTREKVSDKKSWSMPIPEGVRDVIGKRLDRLSPRCNDLLTTAAVVGRRFALAALVSLYAEPSLTAEERLSEDRVLEVLEEALAARVIEELPSGPGRYQFTHALIQETLAGEISTTRKVRLHARIALVLEELYKDRLEERAAELAGHFAEAETVLGVDKIVHYSQVAGDRALALSAHEEALIHFQRGLSAVAGKPMSVAKAALLAGRGVANVALVNTTEALADVSATFEYFERQGDFARAATVAQTRFVTGGGQMAMIPILERALRLLDADSLDAARIMTILGRIIGASVDPRRGEPLVDKAISIARRIGDAPLEMRALTDASFIYGWNMEYDSMLANTRVALEIAPRVREPLAESQLHMFNSWVLAFRGDRLGAQRHFDAALVAAEKAGDRDRLSTVLGIQSQVTAMRGEWNAARTLSDRSLRYSPSYVFPINLRAGIEFQTGNSDQGSTWLKQVDTAYDRWAPWEALLLFEIGECTGLSAHLNSALALATQVDPGTVAIRAMKICCMLGQGLSALYRPRDAAVARLYSALAGLATGEPLQYFILLNTYLGRLSSYCGRPGEAELHFDRARATCEGAGFGVSLAWNEFYRAQHLLSMGLPEAQARGTVAENESLSLASELGMKPLIERILRRREILRA